ncbi:SpaH/EbpB family LPXTG-anchored major pilin [Trueperella pyogenes]|uniref:SpaH/EbpB family LPXTG-anchored major pilin n=1 Tax=Trueperella pyogenes TaxID=1661 RepID=UPI0013E8FE42|nr:SpaH/EbpB family LPXTG-anchored major pilin [Trueperella pyogenes]
MFNHLRKAVVAALAAGALMLAGGAAHATTAPDSIVDTKKTGNIHLVKYDDSKGLTAPQGTKDSAPAANTLDGIDFTLQKVTRFADGGSIDVTKNDQIKKLAELKAADIVANAKNYGLEEIGTEKTAGGGKIDWTGLKVGVYLLTEEDSPVSAGVSYNKAAPSLVFLPTTDPKGDKWIYEDGTKSQYAVWVYPKNSKNVDKKTVKDANVQVGDRIEYTISANVPAVTKLKDAIPTDGDPATRDYNLNQFGFLDNLDDKLSFTQADVDGHLSVTFGAAQEDAEKLTNNSDYKVVVSGEATGQVIKVALTEAGLAKVANKKAELPAGSDLNVYLTFKPEVKAQGIVPNTSYVFKNTGEGAGKVNPDDLTPGTGKRTNTTVSAWGQIKIIKKDHEDKGLNDAVFTVYGSTPEGKIDEKKVIKTDVTTKNVDGVDGIAKVSLHVNDVADDLQTGTAQYKKYFLVETKAPNGYELNREPIEFEVTLGNRVTKETTWDVDADGNVVKGTEKEKVVWSNGGQPVEGLVVEKIVDVDEAGKILSTDQEVINIPVKPKLPMTGGAGVALFGILGLAIIGGGVYAAKRNTKKA